MSACCSRRRIPKPCCRTATVPLLEIMTRNKYGCPDRCTVLTLAGLRKGSLQCSWLELLHPNALIVGIVAEDDRKYRYEYHTIPSAAVAADNPASASQAVKAVMAGGHPRATPVRKGTDTLLKVTEEARNRRVRARHLPGRQPSVLLYVLALPPVRLVHGRGGV